jgi:hypothetical protein
MSSRGIATVAAVVSLICGAVGLVAPGALATVFSITLDPTGAAAVRLAFGSYLAFGLLAWLARDLTDARAWRAVAVASAASWALGGIVFASALLSGLAGSQASLAVVIQVLFALAWSRVYVQAKSTK